MRRRRAAIKQADDSAGLDLSLQEVVAGVEDELLVIDSDYRVRFANMAVRSGSRKADESLIGQLCYKILHDRDEPCNAPLWECPLREVLRSGKARTFIHPVRNLGLEMYLKITTYPLMNSEGNVKAVVELRRDVSAERALETQVLRRHHQLLTLSRISSAVSVLRNLDEILRTALDNVLEIINGAVGGILLLDRKTKTLRYRVYRGLSAKFAEEMRIPIGEGIVGRVAQTGEAILLEDASKDPRTTRPELVSAEGIKGAVTIPLKSRDKVVGVINVVSHEAGRFGADDMYLLNSIGDYLGTAIEQARLYDRLARAGERYRALLRHSLTAQEQERKRIAGELHDETSQALTSLSLRLQAIIGMAEIKGIGDAEFLEKIKTTHAYAVQAGQEVVRLMKRLRPTLLDELGMTAAIHRYAKDTLQPYGIKVITEFKGTDRRFRPEVEVTLFRVAQGAIGNILEHSEAKNALIKLECSSRDCVLRIEDDGKGFDVNKIIRVDPSGRGAGLFTMKERISSLGGRCRIDSKPGQGTKIIMKVPIKDILDEEDKGTHS